MKILLVASTFPYSDTDETPAFVRDLTIALKGARDDLEITVLAPRHGDRTARFTRRDQFDEYRFGYFFPPALQQLAGRGIVPTIESNRAFLLMVPFFFFFEFLAMWRLVRKLHPDLIYAHWFTPQGVNAALVSALTDVPYVLTTHANDVRVWKRIPGLGRLVVRSLLPRAHKITAVSAKTRDGMKEFFSSQEWRQLEPRVEVIPMGVDVPDVSREVAPKQALKERYGYADLRILYFIGRLAAKKGVSVLLEAMVRIRAPDVKLIIAGDGPLRAALEAQSARLGIADVVDFVGYATGQRKVDYLGLADLVIVPSIETASGDREGFPVVIMEALAAGKPCIVSDATGAEDVLVDGRNAFIVPQRDPASLAAKIDAVLETHPTKLEDVAARARGTAATLAWPSIARRHYDFLLRDSHAGREV